MRAVTRRQMLQISAALSASTLLEGCNWLTSPRITSGSLLPPATPSNPQPPPVASAPVTEGTLSIFAPTPGNNPVILPSSYVGLSYEKSELSLPVFTATNSSLIALFRLLGTTNTLRLGGSSVDRQVWTPAGTGGVPGQIAPADVDALAAFLKATGWACLYAINLGGSATGATTPALAAAEVANVAQKLGPALLGVEIGHECDLYGAPGSFYAGNWSLAQFLVLWESYRKAIVAVTPAVAIAGPASSTTTDETSWTLPFASALPAKELSLLTQHYYRGDGLAATSTADLLVTPDTTLTTDLARLFTASQALGLPFSIAEGNSYSNGGAPGASNAYASALWVIDFVLTAALYGASGVNLHGGGSTASYTPIADKNGVVVEARPEFHGILFAALAGAGLLLPAKLSAGTLNITAYAIKTITGLSVLVVNKDSTRNLHLTALAPQTIATASLYALTQLSEGATGPSLTATGGVSIQGASVTAAGGFAPSAGYAVSTSGATFTCYVPPLSAVLVLLT